MKTIIRLIIMFFMSSILGASTDNYLDNQLGYTTYKPDTFSSDLLSLKPDGYTDLEFKIGMSEGIKRLGDSYQKNSNLVRRVVVWMSYEF